MLFIILWMILNNLPPCCYLYRYWFCICSRGRVNWPNSNASQFSPFLQRSPQWSISRTHYSRQTIPYQWILPLPWKTHSHNQALFDIRTKKEEFGRIEIIIILMKEGINGERDRVEGNNRIYLYSIPQRECPPRILFPLLSNTCILAIWTKIIPFCNIKYRSEYNFLPPASTLENLSILDSLTQSYVRLLR